MDRIKSAKQEAMRRTLYAVAYSGKVDSGAARHIACERSSGLLWVSFCENEM